MNYTVYVLKTSGNTLYVGQTDNLERRLKQHAEKHRGAKYLRMFSSFTLVHTETYGSRSEALKREAAIRRMPREKKNALVADST